MPWRKYRIEIHSGSIRTILIHSDIYIRANANHSEPIRKKFCIAWWKTVKNKSDLIRLIPRHQSEWIRNQVFNAISDWSKLNFQSELIWIVPTLGSFVFDRFLSNETQNVFRIGLEWFALARIQISKWIWIVLIDSEWILIQYFRQGVCITL